MRAERHIFAFFLGARLLKAVIPSAIITALFTSPAATASTIRAYDVPADSAVAALKLAAKQSGVVINISDDLAAGIRTKKLKGNYTTNEAFRLLLRGTGLSVRRVTDGSYVLEPTTSASTYPMTARELGTVIVTGDLRNQPADRYAGSDTALTGVALEQLGASSMQDYLGTVPGVSFASVAGPGLSNITIRGVGTSTGIDQGQQTTGIYIDGVPLSEAYFNLATPDIDTFDVDRVEVLKGPQGTTFGTGAMGGAINYVPNKPDTGMFEGRFQVGADQVDGNGSLGRSAKAMVNIPVTNDFAIRAVVTDSRTPGYIDNLGTGRRDANATDIYGGRLMMTWNIDPNTTLSWLTLYQKIKDFDVFNDDSLVGTFKEKSAFPQYFFTTALVNSLKIEHKFSTATLNVILSDHRKTQADDSDYTPYFEGLFQGMTGPIHAPQNASAEGNTAEVRLTSTSDSAFQWLVGSIYDETSIKYVDTFYAPGATAAINEIYGGNLGDQLAPNNVFYCSCGSSPLHVRGQEAALYGEGSYSFTPEWKLTVGARYYDSKVSSTNVTSGFYNYLSTGVPVTYAVGRQSEQGVSPKASLAYLLDKNTMVYALVSTGFRYGGPNPNPPGISSPTPASFGSDKLTNYELGLRTSNEAKTLTASVTGYFIDWRNIQVREFSALGLAYATNAGSAYTYGSEVSLAWQPNHHFEWQGDFAFGRAKLVQAYEQSATQIAPSGTLLPGSSKWSGSSLATYRFDGAYSPFVTATYQYRSKATIDLFNTVPKMGNYELFGLRGGLVIGNATYTAYVENIGNAKGLTNVSPVSSTEVWRYYVQPRTIGLMADFKF